jgi:AcrR family transcriptional regulator
MAQATPTARTSGLRERKKQRTREHISATAVQLFADRGFESVTIAEIARTAEVSEQTVYNYFSTKEDLVFWRLERIEDEMVETVSSRAPNESIIDAFGRFLLDRQGLLHSADPAARAHIERFARMVAGSPALRAREREVYDHHASALAALVAQATGASAHDVQPWIIANALVGIHRALVEHARSRLLAGVSGGNVVRETRRHGRRALATLKTGLAGIDT